jgi:hypothetical protein
MPTYAEQTFNASNPIARYSHRNRLRRSVALALPRMRGRLLDYGCGSVMFINAINGLRPGSAIGYEPFMAERQFSDLPIYREMDEVISRCPFSIVTLFETIEHLDADELDAFLNDCELVLEPAGGVLVSGPIEVGPAVLAKEASRSLLHHRAPENRWLELMGAAFLGNPSSRAPDIKTSHKGFDFRWAIANLRRHGWQVAVLGYGPLPIGTWYGNSQFYLWVSKP